jgi:hypothetical protein
MTTITTYADLKQNLIDHGKRTDAIGKLDTFIDLAESDIADDLRVREMEARATSSTSTVSRFSTLPTGFIKMRRLQILVDGVYHDLSAKPVKDLEICESTGTPMQFSVTAELEFDRVSDQAYVLEMQYFRSLEPLSDEYPVNDILLNYPMLYLSGSLKHFFNWSKQKEESAYWSGIYDLSVAKANKRSRKGRYGPNVSGFIHKGMIV